MFLDEPTSGVDPVARRQFWDLLYEMAGRGVTLFVTTHYMEEASHCHRLAFIYRGRIVAEGSPHEIRSNLSTQRVYDVTVTDADLALSWLETADGISEAYLSGAALHAVLDRRIDAGAQALRYRLAAAGFADARVEAVEPTIEDVFVNLVSQGRTSAAQGSNEAVGGG